MIKQKSSFLSNTKKFFSKIFNRKKWRILTYLPKVLSKIDKMILLLSTVVIIASLFFIWRQNWIKTTHEAPANGGTYTEGIVGEPKDLDKFLTRLTGAGLTRVAADGSITGDLAESWEIQDEGKTYQFKLRDGYSSGDLANQLETKNVLSGIEVIMPADNLMSFKFKQSYSPFLYTSTEPFFSYGPYQIAKEEKDAVTLEAVPSYFQGKPYISKIIIRLYPNVTELEKAAKGGDIMGYLTDLETDWLKDSTTYQMKLSRELDLFFNLGKDPLKDVNVRKNLKDNKPLGSGINLVLATSENSKNVAAAEEIQKNWKALNANIEIKKYDNVTLQKDIIPNRNYDLLLYGLDYGADPDPYPFWHSSQAKADGMNLSNFSDKKADKLLEDARQTFDNTVRNQKYDEFKQILDAQVPYITIKQESLYYTISNKIKGITKIYGFAEGDRFISVKEWYIKSKRVK